MKQPPLLRWLTRRPRLSVLFLLTVFDLFFLSIYIEEEKHILHVAFLDIGQGDAIFIESPTGVQMLYDAGPPSGAVLRALSKEMPFYDRSIDIAVFSHPDMDHVGGFADIFDHYKVDVMLEPGASSTNGVYDEIKKRVSEKQIPRILARRGMSIDLGGGAYADILYPDRDMTNMETNAASIVMRVRYGSTSVLLSGDLPIQEEEYVVTLEGNRMQSQVLKLGHHGSHTSSSEVWLSTIHPDMGIISAGKDNRYGHPHQEVLDLLKKLGIPYLITFQEGTIDLESDGKTITRR